MGEPQGWGGIGQPKSGYSNDSWKAFFKELNQWGVIHASPYILCWAWKGKSFIEEVDLSTAAYVVWRSRD